MRLNKLFIIGFPAFLSMLSAGCGGPGPARDSGSADATDDGSVSDGLGPGDAGPTLPNIREALECGLGPPESAGLSNELQRFELDPALFPDALCNDGTRAALYFRPYRGEANRNKWVINLRGGGSCNSGETCAARWCWCRTADRCPNAVSTTNFSMKNMSGSGPDSHPGEGIMLRGDAARPNPLGDYNQVRLQYCSSDAWHGTRRAVPLETRHPITGVNVAYSIHFLGARILDADITTLRQDGAPALVYRSGATSTMMPDLDQADDVVIAGDSGGGVGTITNLDYLAELLRSHNTACTAGGSCPLTVVGLIDAAIGPDMSRLDLSTSVFAPTFTTYPAYAAAAAMGPHATNERQDASCGSWHATHMPGTEYLCSDAGHVIRHHVATPFFVRMALLDSLFSAGYVESRLADPVLGTLDARIFAILLQREMAALPMLQTSAEEGSAIATAPGVFAPACTQHDTINSTEQVYNVSITPNGGSAVRLYDVFGNWRGARSPSAAVSRVMGDTVCM